MAKVKYPTPDTLVALLKTERDLAILREQGWYRIPVRSAPKILPQVEYLAFYQPKAFGAEKWRVRYYGRVNKIEQVRRIDLLPDQSFHPRSHELYHRIEIDKLLELPFPILSWRGRRIVFIPTTFEKLCNAQEINDLFHGSPLEDDLWLRFRQERIEVERQYYVTRGERRYYLDFALFCRNGKIDVECDGDRWHITKEKAIIDNERDNLLTKWGWHILRFSTAQLRRTLPNCLDTIKLTINQCGGLVTIDNQVRWFDTSGGTGDIKGDLFS